MDVAVVVPVFKQSQYLVEAVGSVLVQRDVTVRIVIVNDGCPHESTHEIGRALACVDPDRVLYIRQENGGLSAARNSGIEAALQCWPSTEAIFLLDADNRLSPTTIRDLSRVLASNPEAGWASPSLETFGSEYFVWRPIDDYSSYRQLHDNQCDAGSLIRREVFESGLRYRETMRHGYEDWEFFIQAGRLGYAGVHAGCCGFRYRRKGESLLSVAVERHEQVLEQMRQLNVDLYRAAGLELEDRDLPRFARFDPFERRWFRGATAQSLRSSPSTDRPVGVEALLVVAGDRTLEALGPHLAGVLLRAQYFLRRQDCYSLTITGREGPGSLLRTRDSADATDVHLVVAAWHAMDAMRELGRAVAGGSGAREVLEVAMASDLTSADVLVERSFADLDLGREAPQTTRSTRFSSLEHEFQAVLAEQRPQAPHREWSFERHVTEFATVLPSAPSTGRDRTVAFVVPWLVLGGVDHCVVQLADAIRVMRPGWKIHLVLTERAETWGDEERLDVFDAIVSVADIAPGDREQVLVAALINSDVVVNAHSGSAFDCLPLLRKEVPRPHYVCYSHVIDRDADDLPTGWPETAAQLDAAIDTHLVISDRLRAYFESNGVARDKVIVGRNAPVVRPRTDDDARGIVAARRRRVEAGAPTRLLFAGRLDRQKGLSRLEAFARMLPNANGEFEMTVVGDTVLGDDTVRFPGWVRRRPPENDGAALSAIYADHDILILPSLWEGVPLVLLDAMAHGMVPIATAVGAVDELIADRRNGYLLDPTAADSAVVDAMIGLVSHLHSTPAAFSEISARALETALSQSWVNAAAPLVALAEAT